MNEAASEAVARLQRASGWRKQELQALQSAMPAVAHGERRWLSDDSYAEHTRRVLTFIDTLEDEVIGSIRDERYLRSAA